MKQRHHLLVVLAALIWGTGVVFLVTKSSIIFMEASDAGASVFQVFLAVTTGIFIGIIKAKYLFTRLCNKNIQRIMALKSPKFWQCYRPHFFFFLALMIWFGSWAHDTASGQSLWLMLLAVLELSVATALFLSWKCFLGKIKFSAKK